MLRRTDAPALVAAELARAVVEACHLTVEITESAFVDEGVPVASSFAALRQLGVTLSIDGSGTGSSMSHLERLPAQELKIDRSFVRDIEHDTRDLAIVRTLVQLAHGLGLGAVAQGVESAGAPRLLSWLG